MKMKMKMKNSREPRQLVRSNYRPAQYHLRPSERIRPVFVKSPGGLIDVWRVQEAESPWRIFGSYRTVDKAYEEADKEYLRGTRRVTVVHKAAIEITGRLYAVNVRAFKFKDEPLPEPDRNEAFLADFVQGTIPTEKLFNQHLKGERYADTQRPSTKYAQDE